jgi:hypothetical protein
MTRIKLIDAKVAKEKMQKQIVRTETQVQVVEQIIKALLSMNGEVITKRIATKLKKQYPSFDFSITNDYSWYELNITGYDFDQIHLQLAYNSEPKIINTGRIIELNQRYLLDRVRIPNYNAAVLDIESNIQKYNDALIALTVAQKAIDDVKWMFSSNETVYVENHAGFTLGL